MHRNTCLEALLEQGTVPSEEHEMSLAGHSAIEGGTYTYKGEWKDNLPHGKGTVRWSDGLVQEGEFRKGKPHGLCKSTFRDGRIADIHYHEGKKHGPCITYKDGSVMEEMFHKKTEHALSRKITLSDGLGTSVTNEQYHMGKRHGLSKITYPCSFSIESEESTYYRGTLHGLKTITWKDGTIATMNYCDDKLHGEWKKVFPNGKVECKIYREGKLQKLKEAPAAHASSSKAPVLGKRGREDDVANEPAKAARA